jgi:hypothetical protein
MKTKILISIFSLILVSNFGFMGCSSDESSDDSSNTGLTPAEDVTIEQLKSSFPAPTGSGSMPSNKGEIETALDDLDDIEGDVDEAVDGEIPVKKANLKKILKSSIKSSAIVKTRGITPKETAGDSGSWDEEGTIDLALDADIESGKIEYDTHGTYSWSESETTDESQGVVTGSYQDSLEQYLKLKIIGVKPQLVDITLNGFINENSRESSSSSYDLIEGGHDALSISYSQSFSYRSGYAISGNVYTGYIIVSIDMEASLNKTLTPAELAVLNSATSDEEWDNILDGYINDAFVLSGGATITSYNAAGTQVYSETYTAEELWAMD